MLKRFIKAVFNSARQTIDQSAAWAMFARDMVSGFLTTAHHTLMILGLVAIGALSVMFVKPHIADQLKALSPFAVATAKEPVTATQLASLMGTSTQSMVFVPGQGENTQYGPAAPEQISFQIPQLANEKSRIADTLRQQQWVTSWLSKRYRVAGDATNMLVSAVYLTAKEIKLDPLLILAVMAIESGFNPFAESPMGAQGLMQVMSKVHHEKFQDLGGVKAALNPMANIKVGSLILKDYVTRSGSIEAGLKLYVGAAAFSNDFGYGAKVLAEYNRLKEVAIGKNIPVFPTTASRIVPKPHNPDAPNQPKLETPADAAADLFTEDKSAASIGQPQQEKNSQVAAL